MLKLFTLGVFAAALGCLIGAAICSHYGDVLVYGVLASGQFGLVLLTWRDK